MSFDVNSKQRSIGSVDKPARKYLDYLIVSEDDIESLRIFGNNKDGSDLR